jgi:hypothetical protein
VLLASLGVAIGALLAAPVGPSAASPTADPAPVTLSGGLTAERIHNQELVDAVIERMWQSADTSGYARATVDVDALTVQIMWKGTPPPDVKSLVGLTADGVRVSVVDVPYNAQEMIAAGERVLRAGWRGALPVRPVAAPANATFDGLDVEVPGASLARSDRTALRKKAAAIARMPVTVMPGAGITPAVYWRWNDVNGSWHGGAGMVSSAGICSTGFVVLTTTGEDRILSAGHCDPTGNLSWTDGNGDLLTNGGGDVWVYRTKIDSLVMDPVGGALGRVWGGPWNASSSHPRYVLSVGSKYQNAVGDYVCTDGAVSGEHCGNTKITAVNVPLIDEGISYTMHQIYNSDGNFIMAEGDSGGPVYALRSDGRVSARGIIFAGLDAWMVTCPAGSVAVTPNRCWYGGYFSPINTILDHWDKTIKTSS